MTTADHWVDRYLRRVHFAQFLHRGAEWLAAFLFVFGSAMLAVKLLLPGLWPHALWLAAVAIPVALAAWWHAQRSPYSRHESVAMIDRRLNLGGLLMTLSETPDSEWHQRLPQAERVWRESLPRFRPVRFARFLGLPLVFAVGACFVPLREASTAPILRNTVGREATQQLEELLESLDEAAVLEEEEREQLAKEIEKLAAETEETPLTHEKWETVDALRDRLQLRVDESAATVAKASQAAATLAKAAAQGGPELSLARTELLEKEVAELLRKMSNSGKSAGLSQEMRDQLQRLSKNGDYRLPQDPAERQEVLEQLQNLLEKESQKLSELRRKCQGSKSGLCEKCGKCHGEGLCQGGTLSGNRPGRGGVNRGRGDAPLTWGDESNLQNTKFKETVLPPGFLDDPQDEVVGLTRLAPEVDPAASSSRGALKDAEAATGNETWNRTLRPRHRAVVRKYFDSDTD